ncbi:unnamed protein product, partial [Ectocarpus fasciculatus]
MEQGSSNGSRSSGDYPAGASASTSAEVNGGDSSVDRVTKSNQEEEEEGEDDRSVYGSEDFDDQSKGSAAESEYDSRDYGFGEDDHSSTNSPTTADGSQTQTTGTVGEDGEVEARNEAKAGGSTATGGGGGALDEHNNSLSSYAEDDFADDDSIVPPAQEATSTPPPSDKPSTAAGVAAASKVDGNETNQQRERGEQSTDGPAAAAGVTASPSPSFNQPDRLNSNGGDKGSAGKNGDRHLQESASDRGDDTGNNLGATTIPGGAGGVVREVNDKGQPMDSLPPVTELEERLRQANLENARLREAAEQKSAATAGSANDGRAKKELEVLKHQVEAARAVMLSSLADAEDKPERTLLELVLLAESQGYKQAEKNHAGGGGSRRRKSSAAEATASAAAAVKAESIARAELEKRVESLERDLARAGQESRAQSARAASLQRQLDGGGNGGDQSGSGQSGSDGAGGGGGGGGVVNRGGDDNVAIGVATADIMALKVKATQLVERLRQEKSARLKAERKTQKVAGKVQVLSDHIEKLMMFLKHEATQKAKAHEQQRRLQKELELVKARSTALLRSNQAKDRVTTELREGSKILEDQLRLMDEKYMELRTKLDWTRTKADKDVRRARAQASALRTKWAILCGDGEGGGGSSLLDTMQVDMAPPGPHLNHSSSAPGTAAAAGGVRGGGVGAAGHNNNHGAAGGGHSPKFASNSGQHGGGPSRAGVGSPPIARGGGGGGGRGVGRGVPLSSRGGQGPLAPSTSDPSLLRRQQQTRPQRGGFGGGNNNLNMAGAGGAARGGSPPGGLSAGLSAGTDPGGELLGDMGTGRGGTGGGGQRPPWSEQGGGGGGG